MLPPSIGEKLVLSGVGVPDSASEPGVREAGVFSALL
jgi:hypothetical protein